MREKSAVLVARHRPVDRTLLVLAALAIAAAVASSVSFRSASTAAPGAPSVVDERRTTTPEGMDTAPARGPAEAAPATGTANDAPLPTLMLPQRDGAPQPGAAPGASAGTADPAAPLAPGSAPASREGTGRPELVTDGLPYTVPPPPPDPKPELRQ